MKSAKHTVKDTDEILSDVDRLSSAIESMIDLYTNYNELPYSNAFHVARLAPLSVHISIEYRYWKQQNPKKPPDSFLRHYMKLSKNSAIEFLLSMEEKK